MDELALHPMQSGGDANTQLSRLHTGPTHTWLYMTVSCADEGGRVEWERVLVR